MKQIKDLTSERMKLLSNKFTLFRLRVVRGFPDIWTGDDLFSFPVFGSGLEATVSCGESCLCCFSDGSRIFASSSFETAFLKNEK